MLEVVFSDTGKGAMKMAKKYDKQAMTRGAIAYYGKKPSKAETERQLDGRPVGGDPADVVSTPYNLDIGDISGERDGEKRKDEFRRVFHSVPFSDSEIAHSFDLHRRDYDKLLLAAKNGEKIRAWKSGTPFSACAFAFLCDSLRDIACEMCVIALPEYPEISDGSARVYADWAELPPGQLYRFLPLEREISDAEKRIQSNLWRDLKAENAPLRALVNGRLISVPEDFYDHILKKYIPDGDFTMAFLIGTVLGRCPLGVGDGWYALRIQKMIAGKELAVVGDQDNGHPYGKILRKV